ncbi:MAG: hypothetical protein KJ645_01115 [Planctomycetes bacterium]|nr:hypothetical protein [Planctomycetota bacterium]
MENCIFLNYGNSEIHILGGSPLVYFCNVRGGWPGPSNFDDNPQFVSIVEEDFHLKYSSPCKDNGNNLSPGLPGVDFEDDPRVVDGIVDVGADEFHRHFYHSGETTPGGTIYADIVGLPGEEVLGMWFGSGIRDVPLNTAYGDWYLEAPLLYLGPLGDIPSDGVMIIPATLPASIPGPYTMMVQVLVG